MTKTKEKPLILNNVIKTKNREKESPYKYCHKNSYNTMNGKPFIKSNNNIVNLDTLTETSSSDAGDDVFYYLDLDTMTRSFSDSGDEIWKMN